MAVTWTGARRIAFIPVSNEQVDTTVPNDFEEQVYRRVFVDPDPNTGVDRSLQAYIQRASSGRAHITGRVFPHVVAPDADVISVGIESLPKISLPFGGDIPIHGFDYAVMVLPHSMGVHRSGYAWMNNPPINGISNRARVALYTSPSFAMQQPTGVWAMEVLHAVTFLGDLYNVVPQLGSFDVMACACGTHPSAHTKQIFGWLNPGAIAEHPLGDTETYRLHAVSHMQPPPPGRVTAVRVQSQDSANHFLVEARLRTDDLDGGGAASTGIATEGVIVYEVQSDTMVFLRASGLGPGDNAQFDGGALEVRVSDDIAGGMQIRVGSRTTDRCEQLASQIEALQQSLDFETDINVRKQLISKIAQLRAERDRLFCFDQPQIWDESISGRLFGDRIERSGWSLDQAELPTESVGYTDEP